MALTDKFDDAVADANDDVTGQINAAEAVIEIGVDADYYSDVLAGGRANARDRVTMGLVDKTLDILGEDVDIRSFIDTPMPVDFLLDDVADIEPVRIRGSFTLPQLWDQIFDSGVPMGSYRDETATSVETAILELDNWYATIDTAEDPAYPSRVAEARSTIAELTPIRDDLRAGDDEQRARGLQAHDPDALGALLAEPEGTRVTVADSDLRRKVEAVNASPPRARPTAPLGTQQRERLSLLEAEELEKEPASRRRVFQLPPSDRLDTMGPRPELSPEIKSANARNRILREQRAYDAEVERRTRLEEELASRQMRADAIARVSGPEAIERAQSEARANRVRGRGDAKASFEEGMAALRSRPPSTPTTEVDTAAATVGFGNRATPEMLERFLTLPRTSDSGAALGDEPAALTQLEEFTALREAGVDATTAFNEVYGGNGTGGLGGTPQLTATQIRDANETEVHRILTERFGGFSFFLQKHDSRLQVGITEFGEIVEADDERADTVQNILDVMVERGIVDPGLIRGLVQKTEWWKTTDARMREYDVLTADMSEPQKLEYLEPVLELLEEEAQYLGLDLDPQLARELAETITKLGEEGDIEFIRGTLVEEGKFKSSEATMSEFAAQRDRIVALSKKYFTPIGADRAAGYAQEIYVGDKTMGQVEQIFKETIANTMPELRNALDAGVTPDEYYAPYKYEIERMLGRPNIDLYEEFGDVLQHIPDGGGQARPMTLSELRRYVRGLPEWQQSTQGKDSARALAFAIGKTFGEVA